MNFDGYGDKSLRVKIAALLGTASIFTLANVLAAQAQDAAATPVEEVLVTGSLIHGTSVVGVPVTTLSTQAFQEAGALTISDVLKNVPAVFVGASTSISNGGGQPERGQTVDIRNLSQTTSIRTLMLFDGLRYPVGGSNSQTLDPSLIPQIAVDHVDVLPDGASATYGSDAVAGVVNVIMKRGYDGAATMLLYGTADGGDTKIQASQLYGRVWDKGDITLSYEYYNETPLRSGRPILTYDFSPWGLDNRTPVISSVPGIVSTGAPNATIGTGCTNCYSVPKGQDGQHLSWTALFDNKGVLNEVNPYDYADLTSAQQRNAATITFDQEIVPGVQFFLDGFYSNRRSQIKMTSTYSPGDTNSGTYSVPTTNPYYPAGAPAGLRVSYSFAGDLQPFWSVFSLGRRYAGGFNLDLPFDWKGKVYGSVSDDENVDYSNNLIDVPAVNAALGNTVAATPASGTMPGVAAFTKPANVPYLNLFCDASSVVCNTDATLNYIKGFRKQQDIWIVHQYGATFDGPLFDLPGGAVKAAVGGDYVRNNYIFTTQTAYGPNVLPGLPVYTKDSQGYSFWAVFGQLNIPVFSDTNAIPLFKSLEFELSGRYDRYNTVGGTSNPKVSFDWKPFADFSVKGSYGTSFRAPSFGDVSTISGVQIQPANVAAGASSNTLPTCSAVGATPVANSAGAGLNPTCSAAQQFPGGIVVQGGEGGVSFVRSSNLAPEKAKNYTIGFDFAPSFLEGFDISATYFKLKVDGVISGLDIRSTGNGLLDPNLNFEVLTAANTPNFAEAVQKLIANPKSALSASAASNIQFIADGAFRNLGTLQLEGIDFDSHYTVDMDDFGVWHAGITGTYYMHRTTTAFAGAVPVDAFCTTVGSGATVRNCVPSIPRYAYRAQLGWADADGGLSATVFLNYRGHYYHNQASPPAAYLAQFPNYSNILPPSTTMDVSIGYSLGATPQNEYLKNINFQLTVNNIANRMPPFAYRITSGGGQPAAFDTSLAGGTSPVGRYATFVVTKAW